MPGGLEEIVNDVDSNRNSMTCWINSPRNSPLDSVVANDLRSGSRGSAPRTWKVGTHDDGRSPPPGLILGRDRRKWGTVRGCRGLSTAWDFSALAAVRHI